MKRILFLSTLLSLTGITIQAEGIKDVDCKVFSKLVTNPDIQLVDCRTPEEFAEGHINGAILIDYKSADFKGKALEKLTPEKKVAIYCRSGREFHAVLCPEKFQTQEAWQESACHSGPSGTPV